MVHLERLLGIYINRDLEKGIEQSTMLFERANQGGSIKIVAGEIEKRFYNDSKIIKALEDAKDRKVSIDIIFGPIAESGNDTILKLWKEDKINLWLLKERYPKHFMLIDDKHVRVEEFHLPGQKERRAFVYKTSWLGSKLAAEFVKLQAQAQHLLPNKDEDKKTLEGIQKAVI